MSDTMGSAGTAAGAGIPAPALPARGPVTARHMEELLGILRAAPHGGVDDATRNFALPPQVRATVSPIVNGLRWGAVMYGMVLGVKNALAQGDFRPVVTLTVCLFLTTWRTVLPIRLASTARRDQLAALIDTAIVSTAIGVSGGLGSPFVFSLLAVVVVAAFGWGLPWGAASIGVGVSGLVVGAVATGNGLNSVIDSPQSGAVAVSILVATVLTSFARTRLLEAERRRASLAGRIDALSETNDLLTMLNSLARSLPSSLNLREALDNIRTRVVESFGANVVCLMEFDEANDEWVPKLAEACVLRPTALESELPSVLVTALRTEGATLVSDLHAVGTDPIGTGSRSGMYVRLQARERTIGLLGVEHGLAGRFTERDRRLLDGLAEVLALTLDNARWFGRLRSLGAEEERVRIARDLHDRLGQWLTYISFELERIITTGDSMGDAPELESLHQDVQTALEELRETLRQLRSGVAEGRPLVVVGKELIDRFEHRTGIDVRFDGPDPSVFLAVPVENELLRIMQESLNNIDKHAKASVVEIAYRIVNGVGTLTIRDNGVGFDSSGGVRDSAYGLVGMRERADVIGARLTIDSEPGVGTTVTVVTRPEVDESERVPLGAARETSERNER